MKVFQEIKSCLSACIAFGFALTAFSSCSDSGSETAGATSETTNGIAVIAFDGAHKLKAPTFPSWKPPLQMIPEWCNSKLNRTNARMQSVTSRGLPAKTLRSWSGRNSMP